MHSKWLELLRRNFRCGRMLCSRADDMAGQFAVPTVHLSRGLSSRGIAILQSGRERARTVPFVED